MMKFKSKKQNRKLAAEAKAAKVGTDQRESAKATAKRLEREAKAQAKRWKPIRRGSLYCSPGCGRGCTVAEHRQAKATAKKLAKELGPGWRWEVSENLGWHHKAISKSGRITVTKYPHYYCASIGDDANGGYWNGSGVTGKAAIADAKAKACESLMKNLGRFFDLMPGERIAGFSIQAANGNGKAAKVRGMHLLK